MLKKHWKPIIAAGLLSVVAVGCSNDQEKDSDNTSKEKKETVIKDNGSGIMSYYKMDDKEVLVEVDGKKLTVGEVKEKAFNQLFITEVNQFIEKQVLLQKHPVSEEELNKKLKEYGEFLGTGIDVEQIRLQIAYDKAARDGLTVTEKDLKEIYENNFKNSGKTFEEMKETIKEKAPYYLGNNINQKLAELRKGTKITFKDKELETKINSLFVDPYNQTQETQKDNQ